MSSMTWEPPPTRVRVVPDNLESKIGYSSLLAARDALTVKVRSVGTVIASVARAALRRARTLGDVLHLRRAGTLAASAGRWILAKTAVPLGMLRRVASPAGVIWALTTSTGQRLASTVVRFALRLLESVVMGGTDLMMVVLGRCGRIGRWAAGLVGNASAEVVMTLDRVTDKVRSTVGPWVTPNRLHVRVVNAVAGLLFLRQLSGLLPPVLQVPAMVVAAVVSIARSGRDGVARGLRSLARVLADVADATFVAAGVMDGDMPVTVGVQPTEGPATITVEVSQPAAEAVSTEASTDGDPVVAAGSSTGSRSPSPNGSKRTGKKRPGTSGGRH